MLRPDNEISVWLYNDVVDMRKSIDGLSALVEQQLELSPMSEALFVFCNRQRDKIKILYWERNGFVLWYKRLEKQKFHWPKHLDDHQQLTGEQLNWLLDGFDVFRHPPHQRLMVESVL